eukprot:scaffold28098_cov64-Phaeocystis_antarctica.AAC.1
MTSQTRHVSRTRHITSHSGGTRGIAHTHPRHATGRAALGESSARGRRESTATGHRAPAPRRHREAAAGRAAGPAAAAR